MQLYTYNSKVFDRQGILMILFKPHEVFSYIKPYLPEAPSIIEAGAFNGQDTKKMLETWPHATIHAFEPVPEIFARLQVNTATLPEVHRYPVALSDTCGTQTFYVSEKPTKPGIASQAGSLRAPKERLAHSPIEFPYTIQVPTLTIDAWASQYQIEHIDMLWLDMQGHELAVLESSPHILATVKIIHTEVSFIESYKDQPKYNVVKSWLECHGFTLLGTDFQEPPRHFFGNALFIKNILLR